ncbi:MAG: carboxypeptidase-like regulatory domain-containing protein, partial [Acidobacteriota bacterium]|nr:carboxypeptidase-like regulatory domain-containing protein [Acidobacteriota bacterium]
ATVIVRNDATNQEFTSVTVDNGTFNVPALQSGTYTVTITAQGFKQTVVSDVKVDVGKPSSINVAVDVGATQETVTIVSTGAELLNTQNATVGQTIVGRQIVEQPQASRDALDLVTLLPGVQTTGRPRTSTVNGLPKGSFNITIDGTDVQDNLISSNDGFFTFVRPRIDAVDEVTVSTATPGAESSGDGAVQIKFVTRGGTNDFRGSLYWYHRNPALNANYFFNNQNLPPDPKTGKAPINRNLLNQYGGRIGGPITIPKLFNGRDRAFFFVNYEEFRLPEQQLRQRTILSPSAQTGMFQYVAAGGIRSVNLLQLAGTNGFTSTVDPTVGSLLASIRASTGQGGVQDIPGDPNRQNFNFVGQGGQDRYFTTARLDFNLTDNHHLENIWNYQEFGGKTDFLNFIDPTFPGFPNTGSQTSQRWSNTTALRSTLTPTLVNEARFGMLGGISLFLGDVSPAQFANQGGFDLNLNDLGITDATALEPTVGILRFGRFFGNTSNRRNTPSFNFADTLTWVKGTHTFNFGGSYNLIKSFQQDNNQFVPSINFGIAEGDPTEPLFTAANFPGASAADVDVAKQLYATLTGRVTAVDRFAFLNDGKYTLLGEQITRFRQPQFAFYVQDAWRARSNLTLNMGLRWEPQQAPTAANDNFARTTYADLFGVSGEGNLFKPGTLTGRPTQFTALGVEEKLFDTDYNNFAPSVGFAWSPDWQNGVLNRIFGNSGQS